MKALAKYFRIDESVNSPILETTEYVSTFISKTFKNINKFIFLIYHFLFFPVGCFSTSKTAFLRLI